MSRYIEAGLSDIGTLDGDVAERRDKSFEGPARGCVEVTYDAGPARRRPAAAANGPVTPV